MDALKLPLDRPRLCDNHLLAAASDMRVLIFSSDISHPLFVSSSLPVSVGLFRAVLSKLDLFLVKALNWWHYTCSQTLSSLSQAHRDTEEDGQLTAPLTTVFSLRVVEIKA